jgi:hypothetical protein
MLPAQWSRAEVNGTVHELLNPEAPRDEWRRQPLANAYVVISWSITIPTPAHATTSCRYSEIARTNGNGRYSMEGPNFVTAGLARTDALVYAPGRDRIPFPYPGTLMREQDVTMAKSARSPEGRLTMLTIFAYPGCPGFDRKIHDPHGLLKPYHESLLAEARTLNVDTQAGRIVVRELETRVKYADPTNLAPAPIRVVPMPVDQRELQQANPAPAK